jgi:hypothetical protein
MTLTSCGAGAAPDILASLRTVAVAAVRDAVPNVPWRYLP